MTVTVAVSKPILDILRSNGGLLLTTSVKLPSKSETAPVVASNTTFAPGTGMLSSVTTVPVTVVCA